MGEAGPPRFVLGGGDSDDGDTSPRQPSEAQNRSTARPQPGSATSAPPANYPPTQPVNQPSQQSYPPPSQATQHGAPQGTSAPPSQVSPPQTPGPANSLGDASASKKLPLIVGGLVAVLLLGGLGAVFGLGLLGGNDARLIVEPGRSGEDDLHVAAPGEDLSRDTEVLGNARLSGTFFEWREEGASFVLGGGSLSTSDGEIIVYDDGDENVLALVTDSGIVTLVDGEGTFFVGKLQDSVGATFRDADSGRCTLFRIEGEEAERVGRGDDCFFDRADSVGAFVLDDRELALVDFNTGTEQSLGEADRFQVGANPELVVVTRFEDSTDPATGNETTTTEIEMIRLIDVATFEDFDLEEGESLQGLMANGVLLRTISDSGESLSLIHISEPTRPY